jgi:phosphate transport system substrate-binding protein
MKRPLHLLFAAACFACVLVSVACRSTASAEHATTLQLTGAGSTFIYPLMVRWIGDYQQKQPAKINYQSIGSGAGIQQLKRGLVDFAGSDMTLNDDRLKQMPPLLQIPVAAGPVCVTYNLPQLTKPLKLSARTLSGIYLGTVHNWQDPGIRADNPGAHLTAQPILVVHRSDGSGMTSIFTAYLSSVSPEWRSKLGTGLSVSWPVGVGGKGSDGVTTLVARNPGAIGYLEFNYAEENRLPLAWIQNRAGKYIAPSAAGATAAIAAYSDELQKDVRTLVVDPPASAPAAYPITGLTFLLVPTMAKDAEKATQLQAFMNYIIGDGQASTEPLQYSKLPASLQQLDKDLLKKIQVSSK